MADSYEFLKGHYDRIQSAEREKRERMEQKDITAEAWREYDFEGRIYKIVNPQSLVIGSTTHRVIDADGLVHCLPAPGFQGCVLRWKPRNAAEPVQF